MDQEREENNGFGPIPTPRGRRAGVSYFILLAVWLTFWFLAWLVEKITHIMLGLPMQPFSGERSMFIMATFFLLTVIYGLLHSLVLFVEEWKHINSRHGSRYQAFQRCLHFKFPVKGPIPLVLFAVLLSLHVWWMVQTGMFTQLLSQYWELLVLPAGMQLFTMSFLMKPAEVEVMERVEGANQNVAHGLAWSYYTGYLEIVLPGLCERIEKSAWKEKIHPTARRLLVLIPLKCDVRAKLEDADSNIKNVTADLSEDEGLQPVRKDSAGIKGRVYKNDVHCITDPDDAEHTEYCVVEYATVAKTLYDMQESKACEGFSREAREQQVKLLYCTLKNIIEAGGYRDQVVLVPFDITDAEDHKLAKVILQTLEQLKSGTIDMP
ncbi:stimulator of interferon genes protein-like [Branchiostoma floridae x Branchiostoma japonicum]